MIGHDVIQPWAVFDTTLMGWRDSYEANYVYLDETPVILTAGLPEAIFSRIRPCCRCVVNH